MKQLPALCFVAMFVFASSAMAQTAGLFARVASVTGGALLSNGNGSPAFSLTRGYALNPGDSVDTRPGGRVVVDLSDGSLVIVHPGTVMTIKDYRAAASVRELFEITVGTVRVKIHHLTGKPNPYRMNSPTASIAVRGTEFDVIVGTEGDTKVDVFEGAVEVGRLDNPDDRALIEAGRGVLVRPGQVMLLFGVPVARVFPATRAGPGPDRLRNQNSAGTPPVHIGVARQAASMRGFRQTRPGSPAMAQEIGRRIDQGADPQWAAVTASPEIPLLFRFNAFADLHLDTYENPAYAGFASTSEARASLYDLSPQLSVVQSVGKGFVAGGSLISAHSGIGTSRTTGTIPMESTLQSETALSSFSAFVARRFGRSSAGIAIERLRVGSSAASEAGISSLYSDSSIRQTRVTAGISRRITQKADLGAYVRFGSAAMGAIQSSLTFTRLPESRQALSTGRTVEAGLRVRGELAPRLSYGVTAAISDVSLSSVTMRSTSVAAGLGYLLTAGTLVSLDLTAGMLGNSVLSSPFQSAHVSIQRDITKRLFGTASFLNVWRNDALSLPLWRTRYSEAGVGWRFSPDWIAHYAIAHDNIFGKPQHTIALRYTFRFRPQ